MCGIVGYVGRGNAIKPVLAGLNNLEYRGYDSAGVAFCSDTIFHSVKQVGRVSALESELAGLAITKPNLAIGHTRWATHGSPTKLNAHPHYNGSRTIFVVHNGIIENHEEIRSMLTSANYHFVSKTDTEVIPHLIDYFYQKFGNMDKAFETAVKELKGAYAIVMSTKYEPTKIYAARLSSPLVIGIGKDSNMVGSDASAVADSSDQIIYLDDYELAIVERKKYKIKNFKEKKSVERQPEEIVLEDVAASKGDYANTLC
jgi:glucosamine--fructose-6-phosphate aminotransferase (isomerizing)